MSGQSNQVYPAALEAFLTAGIDVTTVDLRVELVSGDYVYSAAHQTVDDLTGRLATSTVLTSVTVDGRSVSCDAVTFASVGPGDDVEAAVLFVDTGDESTSTLVAFMPRKIDTVPVVIATNGGPITLTWLGPVLQI